MCHAFVYYCVTPIYSTYIILYYIVRTCVVNYKYFYSYSLNYVIII